MKLAIDPGAAIVVNVSVTLGDPSVRITSPAFITFTSANWDTYQTVTVMADPDADTSTDGATITVSSTGIASQTVAVTALDTGAPAGSPTALITLPLNGQYVGGANAEFFGNGTDNSQTTRAEFYVDNVLIGAPDVNTTGHYHVNGGHASWNTLSLTNAAHVLRMVVYDDTAPIPLSGSHEITVFVLNGGVGSGGSGGGCGLGGLEAFFLPGLMALRLRSGRAGGRRVARR